ncbi:inactive protein kinase SELMODRAFT_444075 [Impatiens glandulifera]|uniref:inactive protein kinase SELMODRAFT_444075 n=1 Tax=Impatiens glandulifera TaxID=253017 RepID=UPI001FB093E5|nr:inactive protein kinase SELMODRAFT_444075 [Impatiens glandulifera]
MMKKGSDLDDDRVVIVAVKAGKEISRTALVWALTHVVQPGDSVKLIVILPANTSRKWGIPKFSSDCTAGGQWTSILGTLSEQKEYITDTCSQMMIQLHHVYDSNKTKIKLKVVSGSQCGLVAVEAKKVNSSWVILDRGLKKEEQHCLEQLECNIAVMKRSQPKVIRLNLLGLSKTGQMDEEEQSSIVLPVSSESKQEHSSTRVPNVTPVSSPEHTSFSTTDVGTSSLSSLDINGSPFLISEINWDLKKEGTRLNLYEEEEESDSEPDCSPSTSLSSSSQSWMTKLGFDVNLEKKVRDVISLSRNPQSESPPLCSICQEKAPVFGKPPNWFSFIELEHATDGFSQSNFLAEGGFGSVHRGVLPDGRMIAVKQYKSASSSQGDREFCSEVEVLSCAQHRNVVMLIGFCVEDRRRLLVYEYVCNGSLDTHLYGHSKAILKWSSRKKIAVGAARGLRYLHEECRVGCIIHRDMRPNNILLTHDFEPLVGDFGLARWQPDGDLGVETRIIGTFGYLAPEYTQSGQITEKADVYSFGIVLVELITGRKAVDISRPKGQQCLTEWARPLLKRLAIKELIDPRLINEEYSEIEIFSMIRCASLCIRRDPQLRPRMSQVLRLLEEDTTVG